MGDGGGGALPGETIPAGEAGEGEEILTRLYLHITEPFLLGWLCPETKSSHFRPRGFPLKLNSAVPPTSSFLVKTEQLCLQKAQGDSSPDWWLAVTLALLGRLGLHQGSLGLQELRESSLLSLSKACNQGDRNATAYAIHLFIHSLFHPPTHPSTHPLTYPPIHLSIHPFTHLPSHSHIHPLIHPRGIY